jgi:hypothetical protein
VAVGFFLSGQHVPASGIYEVHHREHRLPHEVTLLRNQPFPPCERCGSVVRFKIVRAVDALDERREKIILNALPVMDDDYEQAA